MGLANSADRCNFATEGVNGQAEQWGHTAAHAKVHRPSQSSPPCSRFASCRLLTVPVLPASYGISSDRAWPTLCKRPGRLRPTCASSVRSTGAPSDTVTMPVKIFCDKNGKVTPVPYREHVPPDFTAHIFWLKNRDPAHWRDAWQMPGRWRTCSAGTSLRTGRWTEEGGVDLCQFAQRFRGQTSDIEGSGRSCRRLQRFARSANRQRTPSQRIRFRSVPRV
jgi:hypothetical protein